VSYIDDFVTTNAGRLTREQLTTSLRGAGYDDRAIRAALRRGPRPAEQAVATSVATASSAPASWSELKQDIAADRAAMEYIRANAGQYERTAVTGALIDAGYDRATIDAAWARVAAPNPSAPVASLWRRNPISTIAGAVLVIGFVLSFVGLLPPGAFQVVLVGSLAAIMFARMLGLRG
jgi:hypothetical protein